MKRLYALLAAGVAMAAAAPSFAALVTVPVTFDLRNATVTNNSIAIISELAALSPARSVSKGDTVDLQFSFAPGQSVTLNGQIDLQAYLQAVTGSAQGYAIESGTIKLLNGASVVETYSQSGDSGATNTIGQSYSIPSDFTYNPNSSVTFNGLDLKFTISDFVDDNDNSIPGSFTRSYNKAGFSLSAASAQVSGVPEPAAWSMMVIGFGALGATMRRKSVRSLTISA